MDVIYLLVVDEHGYDRGPERMLYRLVLDENEYFRGPKGIFYLLVVDERGYDLKRGQKQVGLFSPLSL